MSHSYKDFFQAAKSAKSQKQKTTRVKRSTPKAQKSKKPQVSRARKKSPFPPIVPSLMYIVCFISVGWGYLNIDEVLGFINRIEVSPIQGLVAAETKEEKNSLDKKGDKANAASSTKAEGTKKSAEKEKFDDEDVKHFSKLNQRKKELDQRESELNELEKELHEQRKEIEARIRKLEEIRQQIGQVLREKVEVDEERVKKLVDFYSNMKPQNAAKIIATLNEDLAVEILGRMKKKSAADILNLLKPGKAQVLTEKFAGYKRR